jgi:hypothetical protein
MPYTINYAPNIAAMGQLAFAGGYGSRKNELNDQALRMAMQERSFAQQMQQQERQQGFTRERDMWGAQQEDQRYQRSWADKQAAEESDRAWRSGQAEQDRAWREKQAKDEAERRRQDADATSKRAVQQDLDITTQRAKQHDDQLKGRYYAIDAEMAARENGFDTAGFDDNLQGATYDQLERMRDQIRQQRMGVKDFLPKDEGRQLAPGLWYTKDEGVKAYHDPSLASAKPVKPTGMQTDEYWDRKRESRAKEILKASNDAALTPEDAISREQAYQQADSEVAQERQRYQMSEQEQLSAAGFEQNTPGASAPQQQQAGRAPVTQSPSGPQAQVGASGKPITVDQAAPQAQAQPQQQPQAKQQDNEQDVRAWATQYATQVTAGVDERDKGGLTAVIEDRLYRARQGDRRPVHQIMQLSEKEQAEFEAIKGIPLANLSNTDRSRLWQVAEFVASAEEAKKLPPGTPVILNGQLKRVPPKVENPKVFGIDWQGQ